MSIRRLFLFLLIAVAFLIATGITTKSQQPDPELGLFVGRNVNMVASQEEIDGDRYLQRQNEPSIAVSDRNPMHLLAASNDYRLIDYTYSEGPIPGLPEQAANGDAWLGIFKSYNGGQSWKSSLLPGHHFDFTVEGTSSPLYGLGASTDPTVRSGMGLFFMSGIAFDRVEHGRSVIFVTRYVDNNTAAIGDPDPIKYIDTKILDEGTSGQFTDKPWLAIDMPRYGTDTVPIETPGVSEESGTLEQDIPRFNVYIVYSVFLGSELGNPHSKIMFLKSNDCGESWGLPVKLSESVHICQGTNVVVSPLDGTIHIAWRQYARESQGVPHAIVACKSDDMGETFSKATVVAEINPFDQFTADETFRTSAFPALAADDNGLVYVAWSDRGFKDEQESLDEHARIVITTSKDGTNWSEPTAIDNSHEQGHQIMPSLIFNRNLMATWLDTRKSLGNIGGPGNYVYQEEISGISHTIDTWAAQACPSVPDPPVPANPVFTHSTQVSRYIYEVETDGFGHVTDPPIIYQAEFSHPNFPIFVGGTAPFIGDYIDITPAPMFLYDYDDQNGTWGWRFNTGKDEFDPSHSYVSFACNRDVVPPRQGGDWRFYWPPGSEPCDVWTTGMRNQNVYSASITHGIFVGAPVNTKPLVLYRRSFLVFVKNLTDSEKLIQLSIDAPNDLNASFWEFGSPEGPEGECPLPFSSCTDRIVELPVLAHSSITLTVFVQPYDNALQTFRVNVEEIDPVSGNPTGLRSSAILNPDPVNTQMIPVQEEYHTITLVSEDPFPVDLSDATMLSGPIVYSSYLEELLNYSNPDIAAPGLRHPGLRHDTIINPGLRHSALEDPIPTGQVTDLQWKVTNDTNMTSAYSFDAIGETPSVPHQLLIYRVSGTPISDPNCVLSEEEHHELLLTIESPGLRHPGLRHPGLRHPGLRHNTFFLAPGEEAVITLRLIDKNNPHPFDPEFFANTVAGAAIPQASTDGEIEFEAFMWISTTTLPDGSVNGRYAATQLKAEPETESYSWSLVPGYGALPPGLELTSAGVIQTEKNPTKGKIPYDPPYDEYDEQNEVYYKTYNFAVQAEDSTGQTAIRSLSIKVICKKCKRRKK